MQFERQREYEPKNNTVAIIIGGGIILAVAAAIFAFATGMVSF